MSIRSTLLASLSSLLIPTALLHAQTPSAGAAEPARAGHSKFVPSAMAARRTAAIAVDGKLGDAGWEAATPVTNFTQFDPEQGKPATQRTEVRFVYDDEALYIGARMHDDAGRSAIRTQIVRRDAQFDSDFLQIVLDSYHDHLSRAFFVVNPSGAKQDQLGIGTSCCDSGWDPVWDAATSIDSAGWSAELRIPFSQLRFSRDSVQTWGLQVRRNIQRRNELDEWSHVPRTETGGPARFGHLDNLRIATSARHLELLPYVAGVARAVQAPAGDPYHFGTKGKARAGLDLRYLLTPNLTLDATFNPDFGQVEVDPAVVNLSVFEQQFPERRPFFLSGSGVFSFGGINCYFCSNVSSLSAFYSRRIGRSPSGADLARGQFVDVPDASTILGAGKITGRTSRGFTVGLLNAVTRREVAHLVRDDGSRGTQVVEPLTNYFVGRVRKDLKQGNLVLGGIATSTIRSMDSVFVPRLTDHAELVGGDWRYTWDNRRYQFMGNAALTNVHGSPQVLLQRQYNSARFFQRPDRAVRPTGGFFTDALDSTATVMRGGGLYSRISKEAGTWLWESAVNIRTPGFENNDLSLLTRTDFIWYNANVLRQWTKPNRFQRQSSITVGGQQQRNFEGDLTDRQLQIAMNTTTPQFWNVNTFYIWHPALLDERLTRGGPMVQKPGTGFTEFDVSTDSRRRLTLSTSSSYSWNDKGGWGSSLGVFARYRPSGKLNVSFGPNWGDSRSLLQYVLRKSDPTATAFSGQRYVFSALKQKQLVLETRMSMTFTPTMSLELFMQPLFASGHYLDFKEFDAPRQGEFSVFGRDKGTVSATRDTTGAVAAYTIDPDGAGAAAPFTFANPDFTLRSLRGNAVYRWEFKPGSVLYLAWTHSRAGSDHSGDLDLWRDRNALYSAQPDNVFLMKMSWWYAR
jgi:hypothetical protein